MNYSIFKQCHTGSPVNILHSSNGVKFSLGWCCLSSFEEYSMNQQCVRGATPVPEGVECVPFEKWLNR